VLVLGLVSINGGMTLLGSPLPLPFLRSSLPTLSGGTTRALGADDARVSSQFTSSTTPAAASEQSALDAFPKFQPLAGENLASTAKEAVASSNIVQIDVLNYGYSPNVINAPAGQPIQLKLVTNNTWGCTRAFFIPDLNYYELLPDTDETVVDLPPQQAGASLFYTCSMGMYYGVIQFG